MCLAEAVLLSLDQPSRLGRNVYMADQEGSFVSSERFGMCGVSHSEGVFGHSALGISSVEVLGSLGVSHGKAHTGLVT